MASPVWKFLTHPDGTTVAQLVKATGLTTDQVRAELVALEKAGKAVRRIPAGVARPHVWWRAGAKSLSALDALLVLALAANHHKSPKKVRSVIQGMQNRVDDPGVRSILGYVYRAKDPHSIARQAVELYHAQEEQPPGAIDVPHLQTA